MKMTIIVPWSLCSKTQYGKAMFGVRLMSRRSVIKTKIGLESYLPLSVYIIDSILNESIHGINQS